MPPHFESYFVRMGGAIEEQLTRNENQHCFKPMSAGDER